MLKIDKILNKGGAPAMPPPPAPPPPPPNRDDSEEVRKQRLINEERQKRASGLSATDNTKGAGVALQEEEIEKKKLESKTLLGE